MFPGETILNGAPKRCPECGTEVRLKVMQSAAGYYVGSECRCGPYTRETGYFREYEEAELALELIRKGDQCDPRAKVRM